MSRDCKHFLPFVSIHTLISTPSSEMHSNVLSPAPIPFPLKTKLSTIYFLSIEKDVTAFDPQSIERNGNLWEQTLIFTNISHTLAYNLKWIKCSLPFRILFMSSESSFGRVIVVTAEQVLPLSVNVCPSKGSEYSHYTVTMQQREELNSCLKYLLGGAFPGGAALKNPPAMQGMQETWVSIPGSRRSPGGGHVTLLQRSCLENPWTEEPGGL